MPFSASTPHAPNRLRPCETRACRVGHHQRERLGARPATQTIGWIGSTGDMDALKLGGSEDGSTQGHWFTDGELQFLGLVPREKVADVYAVLFDGYNRDCLDSEAGSNGSTEKMGPSIHRMGFAKVLETFKGDERTAELLEKRNPKMGFDPYMKEGLVSVQ